MTDKQLKKWREERDAAIVKSVNSGNVEPFKKFYKKWMNLGVYNLPLPNDKIVKISIYKMAIECFGVDMDTKLIAEQWLKINGFSVGID